MNSENNYNDFIIIYEGKRIPLLIEQRWSGHLKAIQTVRANFNEIYDTLTDISCCVDKTFEADDIALAVGIMNAMKEKKFILLLHFLCELLEQIEPANQILQSREVGYRQAIPIIEAVKEKVELMRNDGKYDNYLKQTENIMAGNDFIPDLRRNSRRPSRLDNFVVMTTIGERETENDTLRLKQIYFEIIDKTIREINSRFTENNEILMALVAANEIDKHDFDSVALKPLAALGLQLPSNSEIEVAGTYLRNQRAKGESDSFLKLLSPIKNALENTYHFLEAVETFGSSSAVCECSFSALSRIDTVRRMTMTDKRLRDLSYIAFEKKGISDDIAKNVIEAFAERNRRIQLFCE